MQVASCQFFGRGQLIRGPVAKQHFVHVLQPFKINQYNKISRKQCICEATKGKKKKSKPEEEPEPEAESHPEPELEEVIGETQKIESEQEYDEAEYEMEGGDEEEQEEVLKEEYEQRQLERKEEIKSQYEEVEYDEEFMKKVQEAEKRGEELGALDYDKKEKKRKKAEKRQPKMTKDEEYDEDDGSVQELEQKMQYQPIMPGQYVTLMLEQYGETVTTQELTEDEVNEALISCSHSNTRHYHAFYSSEFGGVITHPELMLLHMDDHMVHRGHSVFDTAIVTEGYAYQLDEHFMRFLNSSVKAGLALPSHPRQMRRIILDTCAISRQRNAQVRYWLSAGRGGFGLSQEECNRPSFYVMVFTKDKIEPLDYCKGWHVMTTMIPPKHPYFATLKSTNYMQNALAVMDAEQHGVSQGIFVDRQGFIIEGPNMNIGFIKQRQLIIPPFEKALAGITIQRLIFLVRKAIENGMLIESLHEEDCPKEVVVRPVHYEEIFGKEPTVEEIFLTSSSLPLMPVVSWDGKQIGDGEAGEVSMALKALLEGDLDYREGSDVHVRVPYGMLTGMNDDIDDRTVNHIPMPVEGQQMMQNQFSPF